MRCVRFLRGITLLKKGSIALYWGSFDPPTLAHKAIILTSLKHFRKVIIIINNDARKQYLLEATERLTLFKKSLSSCIEFIEFCIQSDKVRYSYSYFKNKYQGKISAIVGADSYDSWLGYTKEEKHQVYDEVVIFPRRGVKNISKKLTTYARVIPICSKYAGISSRYVREKIALGKINAVKSSIDKAILYAVIEKYKNLTNK